jgi:alpha-glucosidase
MAILSTLFLFGTLTGTLVHAQWPTYSAADSEATSSGLSATLVAGTSAVPWAYPQLSVTVAAVDTHAFRVLIDVPTSSASNLTRPYTIPDEVFRAPESIAVPADSGIDYAINATTGSVTLSDKQSGQVLFTTEGLQYGVNHLAFNVSIDTVSTYISGYGEHSYYYFINHDVREGRNESIVLSAWNTDDHTPWGLPMYGVHPVVFVANPLASCYHAVVLMNSHAQQLTVSRDFGLQFYAVGGRLDAFVIRGDSMYEVIQKYHTLITKPAYVPPYWSLGMNQCRWGYKTLTMLEDVVKNYSLANIPLEVIWNDNDYSDQYRSFTTNNVTYPQEQLAAFVDTLHALGLRYVQILDCGVAQAPYSVYESGLKEGVYINMSDGKTPLTNVVWPGWTVFPDFTADRVGDWWHRQIRDYLAKIPVDGFWLDMNEVSAFCNGQCYFTNSSPIQPFDASTTKGKRRGNLGGESCHQCFISLDALNYPLPNPLNNGWQLAQNTLDMTGELAMGKYYDTKAFYGLMEEHHTNKVLSSLRPKERPFLLSRASFMGSGAYTSHWTGDNYCSWEPHSGGIADSVQSCLGSNLWGITNVGADIGGFQGNPEQQLATRWIQLGGFYTFMRSHHTNDDNIGQEPYRFAPEAVDTMRTAILWRYQLLPYMFTEIVKSHYVGGPVMRHPSVNFPTDMATYHETTTFMLGDSLLVAPVVAPNTTQVSSYVPNGTWYRLRPDGMDEEPIQGGLTHNFTSAIYHDTIPALIRAGTALPIHTTPALTLRATRSAGVSLWCVLDSDGRASGLSIFESLDSLPLPHNASDVYQVAYSCAASASGGLVTVAVFAGAGTMTPPAPTDDAFVVVPHYGVFPPPSSARRDASGSSRGKIDCDRERLVFRRLLLLCRRFHHISRCSTAACIPHCCNCGVRRARQRVSVLSRSDSGAHAVPPDVGAHPQLAAVQCSDPAHARCGCAFVGNFDEAKRHEVAGKAVMRWHDAFPQLTYAEIEAVVKGKEEHDTDGMVTGLIEVAIRSSREARAARLCSAPRCQQRRHSSGTTTTSTRGS